MVILLGGLLGWFLLNGYEPGGMYAEAATIADGAQGFDDLEERFQDLAHAKGGAYAYEVLKRAPVPPNTDMHLLAHAVGDVLYEQEGVDAIGICTQDFRNACSHSIVVGALNEYGGESALELIRGACNKAPGGSGAYTMCYHGLGHGVFAYFEYEIPETVDFCAKTGTEEYHNREYIECVGGSIMELMGGGGHDRDKWVKSRNKYLNDDPLAPCSSDVMPIAAKEICYTYITPQLFERAGANMALPQPEHIEKAFTYCDRIVKSDEKLRYACFSGIGKELPLLALARDTRAIELASDAELLRMKEWCGLAPHDEAREACRESIQDSLFWGGENDTTVSVRFCALAQGTERTGCFEYLSHIAGNYLPPGARRVTLCESFPDDVREGCRVTLQL
jgi:hypothetical protein